MRHQAVLSCSSARGLWSTRRGRRLKPLFTEVLCLGRILSRDAAPSSHEFGRLLKRWGGEGIVCVKDKTPATLPDRERFFEDKQADGRSWQCLEPVEKGHGRMPGCSIRTRPDLPDASRAGTGAKWGSSDGTPRERPSQDKHSVEVVSGWTSLWQKRCSPHRLAQGIGAPWAVEKRLRLLPGGALRGGGLRCWLPARGPDGGGAQPRRALLDGLASGPSRRSPTAAFRFSPARGARLGPRLLRSPAVLVTSSRVSCCSAPVTMLVTLP
jgi:hypothetical protein